MQLENYYKLNSICAWVGNEKVFPCDESGLPNIKEGVNFMDLKDDWFKLLTNQEKEHISKLIKESK